MISNKYYELVMTAILAVLMGLFMSGIVTAINTGFDAGYISRWLRAFIIVAPIAFIVMQFLRPLARMIANVLTISEDNGS